MTNFAEPAVLIFVGMMGAFTLTLASLTIRQSMKG